MPSLLSKNPKTLPLGNFTTRLAILAALAGAIAPTIQGCDTDFECVENAPTHVSIMALGSNMQLWDSNANQWIPMLVGTPDWVVNQNNCDGFKIHLQNADSDTLGSVYVESPDSERTIRIEPADIANPFWGGFEVTLPPGEELELSIFFE